MLGEVDFDEIGRSRDKLRMGLLIEYLPNDIVASYPATQFLVVFWVLVMFGISNYLGNGIHCMHLPLQKVGVYEP